MADSVTGYPPTYASSYPDLQLLEQPQHGHVPVVVLAHEVLSHQQAQGQRHQHDTHQSTVPADCSRPHILDPGTERRCWGISCYKEIGSPTAVRRVFSKLSEHLALDTVVRTPCGLLFHLGCWKDYTKKLSVCPHSHSPLSQQNGRPHADPIPDYYETLMREEKAAKAMSKADKHRLSQLEKEQEKELKKAEQEAEKIRAKEEREKQQALEQRSKSEQYLTFCGQRLEHQASLAQLDSERLGLAQRTAVLKHQMDAPKSRPKAPQQGPSAPFMPDPHSKC